MGALVPTLTSTILTQGVGLITNELTHKKSSNQQEVALRQLQAQQRLQESQSAANVALDRQKIEIDAKGADEDRKNALRRAVSRQRANFGAQGIGSGAGSSQAVLLGLFDESEDEKKRREGLDTLRLNALDQDSSQQKSLNVLQRTQLEEKQNLKNISAGGRIASGLFGF